MEDDFEDIEDVVGPHIHYHVDPLDIVLIDSPSPCTFTYIDKEEKEIQKA